MSNSKISALTSATTPLAGTETLPIVQSSATTKVTIANVTAGRAVSTLSVTSLGPNGIPITLQEITAAPSSATAAYVGVSTSAFPGGSNGDLILIPRTSSAADVRIYVGSGTPTETLVIQGSTKDIRIGSGNLVPTTAAKGVNFTANTPASGMTSQLLNWYEEGTWTPNQGSGLTVVGAFSSTGKYTRVGRNLTISGTVTGATSVAVAAAGIITTNLPFTVGTAGHGNVTNAALTSFSAIICTSTNVTSAGAIAATGTLTFSATYFV